MQLFIYLSIQFIYLFILPIYLIPTSSWIFPIHTLSVSPLAIPPIEIEALDVKGQRCDMVLEAVAGGLNNRGWGDHQLEWENGDDENGMLISIGGLNMLENYSYTCCNRIILHCNLCVNLKRRL